MPHDLTSERYTLVTHVHYPLVGFMQNIELERGSTMMRINHHRMREGDDDVDESRLDCTQLAAPATAWMGRRRTSEFHHTRVRPAFPWLTIHPCGR